MTKDEMFAFIDEYLSDKPNCDLYQDTDTDKFPHPPTPHEWDFLIGDLVLTGHLKQHPNGAHVVARKPIVKQVVNPATRQIEIAKTLLQYLLDNRTLPIDPRLAFTPRLSKSDLPLLDKVLADFKTFSIATPSTGFGDFDRFVLTEKGVGIAMKNDGYAQFLNGLSTEQKAQVTIGDIHIGDKIQGSTFRDFKPISTSNNEVVNNPPAQNPIKTKRIWDKMLHWWWLYVLGVLTGLTVLAVEQNWLGLADKFKLK